MSRQESGIGFRAGRMFRLAAAACAGAAAVIVATSLAAHAAATLATIEAKDFTVDTLGQSATSVVCPGNRRAVGGGIISHGSPNAFLLNASGPLDATGTTLETNDGDTAKLWYVSVFNFDNRSRTLRAFALCSTSSKATIEATQFFAEPGKIAQAYAKCPAGKWALGGGVVQSGEADMNIMASGPLDATREVRKTADGDRAKFWYAAIDNEDGTTRRKLRVFAICADDTVATIKSKQFKLGAGQVAEANVQCPGAKRVVGGGLVQIGFPGRIFTLASGPLDASGKVPQTTSGDTAKQWYTFVANSGSVERTLKVFALCE